MAPLALFLTALAALGASTLASPASRSSASQYQSDNVKNKQGFVTVKNGGFYKDGKPYYLVSLPSGAYFEDRLSNELMLR